MFHRQHADRRQRDRQQRSLPGRGRPAGHRRQRHPVVRYVQEFGHDDPDRGRVRPDSRHVQHQPGRRPLHLEDQPDAHLRRRRVQEDDFNDGMVGYWNLDENGGTTITDNSGFTNTGTSTAMTWSTASRAAAGVQRQLRNVQRQQQPDRADDVAAARDERGAVDRRLGEHRRACPGAGAASCRCSARPSAVSAGPDLDRRARERNDGTLLVPATAPSTGTWHHVAYTWNGTNNNTLYVDGVAVGDDGDRPRRRSGDRRVHRRDQSPRPEFFNGSIDEVRIYDRALTGDRGELAGAGPHAPDQHRHPHVRRRVHGVDWRRTSPTSSSRPGPSRGPARSASRGAGSTTADASPARAPSP